MFRVLKYSFISLWIAAYGLIAAPVWAADSFILDQSESTVAFEYDFDKSVVKGRMPIREARITLDLRQLHKSSIEVVLDPTNAVAGFPFATGVMRGEQVLDTARYPTIHFVSTKIARKDQGADITGNITIRDVTHPLQLKAQLFRQQGTDPDDRDHLAIVLTGQLSRSAFGASGYMDLVDDTLRIKITAEINRAR